MVCTDGLQPLLESRVSAPKNNSFSTPLHALHLELGARMVPFAGYSMPVQYPAGLMAEHHHTRAAPACSTSRTWGSCAWLGDDAAAAFESLVPVDVIDLAPGKQRYGLLLTDEGTIIDDLMFVNRGERPVRDRQRRLQGGRHRAHAGAHRRRCQVIPMPERACSRCRARRRSMRWRGSCPASRSWCS